MKKITYIIIVFCVFISNAQNQIPGEKQNESTLFQNAKIVTVTGEIIEKGHLGISQGIIDYIGTSAPEKQYTNKMGTYTQPTRPRIFQSLSARSNR